MKVLKVSLEHLQNEQLFEFLKQFSNLVRSVRADALHLQRYWEDFTTKLDLMNALLEQMRKSLLTKTLQELDTVRDERFRYLRTAIESWTHHYDATKKAAGEKLFAFYEVYGNVVNDEYNKESGEIYNFIQDLWNKCSAELTLLNLNQDLTELDNANKAFENTYAQRNDEKSAEKIDAKMYDVRKDMYRLYRLCIEMIEAGSVFTEEAIFTEFIKDWNENVQKYKNMLARKGGDKEVVIENNLIK
ncbi:MAG: DUF6261 family protein [Bacteroidales bacterium]|jgi:hypothetical protein|nr:DUF6261 family protein [Bacteroidales bacterium]